VMASFPRASLAMQLKWLKSSFLCPNPRSYSKDHHIWSCYTYRIWMNSVNSIASQQHQQLYHVVSSSVDRKKNLLHWQALSLSLPAYPNPFMSPCPSVYCFLRVYCAGDSITLPSFPYVSVSSLSYLSAYLLTDHGFVIIFPIKIAMLEVYRHTKDVECET
jgi:hypothetical protein